jgi:hypothetical protein
MSKYFRYFPTTTNDLTQTGKQVEVTNILKRFAFRTSVEKNDSVFYDYVVQDGDRPDTIAEKYYGDSRHAWIILHFNNIEDPIFDWALFGKNFEDFIAGKYGTVSAAQSAVHEYRKILTQRSVRYDGSIIPERYVAVDQTTYNATPANSRRLITQYDYEMELNEERGKIKLLDERYLADCLAEVKSVLKSNT